MPEKLQALMASLKSSILPDVRDPEKLYATGPAMRKLFRRLGIPEDKIVEQSGPISEEMR